MLLRVGLILAAISILLTAGVALVVYLHAEAPAVAQGNQAESSPTEPAEQQNRFDIGKKLQLDHGTTQEDSSPPPGPTPPPENKPASPPAQEKPAPSSQRGVKSLPVSGANWPYPTKTELGQIGQPRYFSSNPNAIMTLTIEALGLYDVPVLDSFSEDVLSQGLMHPPSTSYPWDNSSQKNVFLAGHRVGLPGTDGRLLFFALDQLQPGDAVTLKDRSGNEYKYSVTKIFQVRPQDVWVADPLVDRDMLTLQTCTYPTFENRLIVRADRA
jgi:sortase A